MGQRKGLIYNAFVLGFLFFIWIFTTSKPGYTPPAIPVFLAEDSQFDLNPLDLTLTVCGDLIPSIPDETLMKIEQVTNTFSQFWDLTVNLKTRSAPPQKIKIESQSAKLSKSLVFMISEVPVKSDKDHIVYLSNSEISEIPNYLIWFLRNTAGLSESNDTLINGLTQFELESKEKFLVTWLDFQISKESSIFNTLLIHNDPKVSEKSLKKIETLIKTLNSPDISSKFHSWQTLQSLNSDPELSKSPYFKWDFKIGVYAPIFFPVLFPICGAIYSRLFLRK